MARSIGRYRRNVTLVYPGVGRDAGSTMAAVMAARDAHY
jgi:hypothetical protein